MSETKVRCIIKRPDEKYGHVTNISTSLKNLQKTVGGEEIKRINVIPGHSVILYNEAWKDLGMRHNIFPGGYPYFKNIGGDIIVIGVDEEADDYIDLDMSFTAWKELLREWGNDE